MFKYFQTQLQTVKYNNEILENAQIVSVLATAQTDGNIEIPTEYLGCSIVGCMWLPTEQKFVQVEEVQEETQLDRIESQTTEILNATNTQTTTLDIMLGVEDDE